MGMMDPPREEVRQAVEICREAGIRMVMITGDYGLTAESLARRVGMLRSPNPLILTGADLDRMNDLELRELLASEVIFARMAPDHKLRLVAAYQEMGEVVAVTGDGVNDAPALRKADVGVAMGMIGTDVAKEAADVIITNDNFATIVRAIEEGRAIYDNIRKFITYIFASNVPEFLPFVFTSAFRIPLALTVRQILAIDLGTDILPALALGTERPEPRVMKRPPRRRDKPLIDSGLLTRAFLWLGMIETALCYAGFYFVYTFLGEGLILDVPLLAGVVESGLIPPVWEMPKDQVYLLAVTAFHAGVVTAQVGNAFACRSEREKGHRLGWFSNPLLWLGIYFELVIIFAFIYIPPLAQAFEHRPLPPALWIGLLMYGPVLYVLERSRKMIVRFLERSRTRQESER
jgi:magnesium-transporting ATPase (P-type)